MRLTFGVLLLLVREEGDLAAEQLPVESVECGAVHDEAQQLVDVVGHHEHAEEEEVALHRQVDVLLGQELEHEVEGEEEQRADHGKHVRVLGGHTLHSLPRIRHPTQQSAQQHTAQQHDKETKGESRNGPHTLARY